VLALVGELFATAGAHRRARARRRGPMRPTPERPPA
jgi:hypothetical protein